MTTIEFLLSSLAFLVILFFWVQRQIRKSVDANTFKVTKDTIDNQKLVHALKKRGYSYNIYKGKAG